MSIFDKFLSRLKLLSIIWPVFLVVVIAWSASHYLGLLESLLVAFLAFVGFVFVFPNLFEHLVFRDRAFRDHQGLYEITVNTTELGLWDWHIAKDSLYWSPTLWSMLGVQDLQRTPKFEEFKDRLHPEEYHWVMNALDQHLKHRTPYDLECRFRHENGDYIWIHTKATATRNNAGVVTRVSGFVFNITQRKRAEANLAHYNKELENSNAWLETVMETVPHGILAVNACGVILIANRAACECFGYSKLQMTGLRLQKLILNQEEESSCLNLIEEVFDSEVFNEDLFMVTKECTGVKKDGNTVPLQVRLNRVEHIDGERFLIAACQDCSEQRKATHQLEEYTHQLENQHLELVMARHKAEQANQKKTEFLANISHEIRTPMNGIVGMATLLLDTPLTLQQENYASMIMSSTDLMLSVINDLLDVSKIEAKAMTVEKVDCDLQVLFEDAASIFVPECDKKGLELILKIKADTVRHVQVDPVRLKQIYVNLLSNAVKFTETGKVTVHISSVPSKGVMNKVLVQVVDTGIGIPSDKFESIFDKFDQADTSITRKFGGTGLGLSISKSLVELMGGEIGVESTLNQGSMFWFSLPVAQASDEKMNQALLVLSTNAGEPGLMSE